ncbi:ABC transporter permease [bacterium]|nr:ABC transporter permease [bacterium]
MIARVARLVAFEWRKLAARRLALLALVLVALVAVISPIAGHVVDAAQAMAGGRQGAALDTQNGWTTLASGLRTGLLFAVIVVLVFSGSSISEETQLRTLKAILIRPVKRGELLLAKWIALSLFAVLLVLVMAGSAAGVSALRFGLADVMKPGYPVVAHTAAVMTRYTLGGLALLVPSLVALVAFGLLFSCAIDHSGYAVGTAIGSFLLLSVAATLSRRAETVLFTHYLGLSLQQLSDIAETYDASPKEFREAIPASVAVSVASAVAFFLGATTLLRSRDVAE